MFYRNKCIGCNICHETLPSRWRMSRADGKSNLIGATEKKGIYRTMITVDELETNKLIADACPVNIIKIEL